MKIVMKKAHELTKKIIRKGDDYRATLSLALKIVYKQLKTIECKIVKSVVRINKTTNEVENVSNTSLDEGNYIEVIKSMNYYKRRLKAHKKADVILDNETKVKAIRDVIGSNSYMTCTYQIFCKKEVI